MAAIANLNFSQKMCYNYHIKVQIKQTTKVKKMTKILVIEDENLIRETILEILESQNFEAVGAPNGQVGVQIASAQIPDLILSDVMMPLLDGFEVLTALRSNSVTASIPFIFMTGTEMEKALKLRADGYLKKPCSATQILAAIANQLQKPNSYQLKISKNTDQFCQTQSQLARQESKI